MHNVRTSPPATMTPPISFQGHVCVSNGIQPDGKYVTDLDAGNEVVFKSPVSTVRPCRTRGSSNTSVAWPKIVEYQFSNNLFGMRCRWPGGTHYSWGGGEIEHRTSPKC